MFARKLVIGFWLLVISLFLTPLAFAQNPSYAPLPSTISPTSPIFTDLIMQNTFHTFSCLMIGSSVIGQPCLTYVSGIPVLSRTNLSGGALGTATSLIGMLYINPPIRTADYLASVGEGLGIVKTAHAQVGGSGAAVLSPILALWQVSRNIAYLIMIIIFVIIGLMVMFRQRINPQTVITVQSALPGLVIGLILITFSYFLASFISDFAFIGTNLVGYFFTAAQGTANDPTKTNLAQQVSSENILTIFSRFTGIIDKDTASNALSSVWDSLGASAKFALTALAVFITAQTTQQSTELLKAIPVFGEPVQAIITVFTSAATAANPTAMAGMALSFIATVILLYTMFKLLMRLISAYLNIVFLTITAPFHFMSASLPGRQSIATAWILNMLCHVLAFPAVLGMFYFVAFLLKSFRPAENYPPFVVSSSATVTGQVVFPLFGGLDLSFINVLLAFGALVATPSIPDIICKTIGRVSQAGQLLGQEISGGIGAGRGYANQAQQGVGYASGQGARLRGLADTPVYSMTGEYDEQGKPIYQLSPYASQAGGMGKLRTWWTNRGKSKGE